MFSETVTKYRPIPFWSWNDELKPQELRQQIRWMHKNGIGGFFMHARSGLKTEYLSEEWMECVEVCCREARELGMDAWMYDENGWPSGFAGGKLLEEQENHDRYILAKTGGFDAEATVVYRMSGKALVRIREKQDILDGEECLNLYICYATSTADILNPKVVEQFLNETHCKYRAHFGDDFPKSVRGFFTDEPQYYRWNTPYTPVIADYYREQYGEDIFDSLGLLFVEKEGYRTFRYRYWKSLQKLMLENYAKKIYDWCEEQGVCLTGHYIEEGRLGSQLWCCGGIMPFYEYEHIPGIDSLRSVTINELPARQLGSVARQLGKERVITESFAACGWDVSPAELKRVVGFQFANGVNMLCHHLLPYSERGVRKCDYPAHFADINPWVKDHFKDFNEYVTRLGYLLAQGEELVNVAVLHPMRSAYFDYKREEQKNQHNIGELENRLKETCRLFSGRGVAYHFLDETLMAKYGFTEGNTIGCGKCVYKYLVLPYILTMDKETEEIVRRFVLSGGKVLMLGQKPCFLEGEVYDYAYLESNCTLEEILLDQPFTMENTDTEIYSAYRDWQGKSFLFLQNASGEKSYTQTFSFPKEIQSFVAMDLLTKETKRMPLTITMDANESLLLFPSEQAPDSCREQKEVAFWFRDAKIQFEENWIPVDMVRYSTDGINYSQPLYYKQLFNQLLKQRYEGKLYLRYEFEVETLPEQIFIWTEETGVERTLNSHKLDFYEEVGSAAKKADITSLVQKGKNEYQLMLDWHQNDNIYYALFGENVTEGLKNCITYDTELEAVYLSGAFGVYSREEFEMMDEQNVCGRNFYIGEIPERISEPVMDGMPFFRGNFTIYQELDFSQKNCLEGGKESSELWLRLEGRYQVAKVEVNGQSEELLFTNKLDISPFVKPGKNELKVTYTVGNRNLLGPLHSVGGEIFVSPSSFDEYNVRVKEDGVAGYKLCLFYSRDIEKEN